MLRSGFSLTLLRNLFLLFSLENLKATLVLLIEIWLHLMSHAGIELHIASFVCGGLSRLFFGLTRYIMARSKPEFLDEQGLLVQTCQRKRNVPEILTVFVMLFQGSVLPFESCGGIFEQFAIIKPQIKIMSQEVCFWRS